MKMKWTERTTARTVSLIIVVAAGLLLYFALKNWSATVSTVNSLMGMLRPFIVGFVMAYLLNAPLVFFEKKLLGFVDKGKPRPLLKRVLAVVLTWIAAAAVLVFFFWSVIPQVAASVEMLVRNIPGYLKAMAVFIQGAADYLQLDMTKVREIMNNWLSVEGLLGQVAGYMNDAIPFVYNIGMQVGGGILDVFVGIIISVYLLCSKETLIAQVKKVMYALFRKPRVDRLIVVARESHRVFSGFISGKLLDSLIIGIMCFIGMSILRMDYALLISFVVGVTNVIPFFGPFFGAIPSCLILLIVDPWQALWFAIFVLALQQFDGNILGPKILGDSTGLPALWVMFAILVGGGLFGVVGMFIGVPTFAVIYWLMREYFGERLEKKGMPTDTDAYRVEKGPLER